MRTDEYKPRNDQERRMWNYMLRHPRFRYADVMAGAEVSRHYIDIFTAKLRRLKLIKQCGREGPEQFYTVMDHEAAAKFASAQKGRKEGQMWTVMRSLVTFTAREVLLVLGSDQKDVVEADVEKYCGLLHRANYLAIIQKPKRGTKSGRYRLVNDTGPLPPVKRTLEVLVDGNEDRAVYAAGARI